MGLDAWTTWCWDETLHRNMSQSRGVYDAPLPSRFPAYKATSLLYSPGEHQSCDPFGRCWAGFPDLHHELVA